MRLTPILLASALALGATLSLSACGIADDSGVPARATEIAWREGDVDDALTEAKEVGKPVILYWGAVWCPPCNQMKATLFKDPAFIAETEKFVPVYLDGDTDGAQRWGEQFGISGYPTVIILQPDGSEITRISSATMASELPELLAVASTRTTTIEALLEKAETDTAGLGADDWRILAGFDWLNDPKHFGDLAKAGSLLDRLAQNAPGDAMKRQFGLLALVVNVDEGPEGLKPTPAQTTAIRTLLPAIMANEREIQANRQMLIYYAADLIGTLPKGAERDGLGARMIAVMDDLFADESLAMTERVDAIYGEIELAKASGGVTPAVLAKVQERAKWADTNAKDTYTRESVISGVSQLLEMAGDIDGAKRMLLAEIERSKTPYYYMSGLAGIYEDEGNAKEAMAWSRKAYETSQGPATRVQWAINYSNMVLRVAPADKAAVAEAANNVIDELSKSPDSYYQRTRVKVTSWGKALAAWSEKNSGSKVLEDLRTRMADVCAREASAAETCRNWSQAA